MKRLTMMAAAFGVAASGAALAQPPQDGGRMFAMMDTNGDGKLDKGELTKMAEMRAQRQGDPSLASPDKVDAFFNHLDADRDGFVTKDELESMRKARAARPPADEGTDDSN